MPSCSRSPYAQTLVIFSIKGYLLLFSVLPIVSHNYRSKVRHLNVSDHGSKLSSKNSSSNEQGGVLFMLQTNPNAVQIAERHVMRQSRSNTNSNVGTKPLRL